METVVNLSIFKPLKIFNTHKYKFLANLSVVLIQLEYGSNPVS